MAKGAFGCIFNGAETTVELPSRGLRTVQSGSAFPIATKLSGGP